MTAVELLAPFETTPDNPTWHELRRQGVSASEIAAVMGLSKWASPFSLYWQKINGWDTEGNEDMSTGTFLEPTIADWFAATYPERGITCRAGLYAHPDRPWQLATPDRLLYLRCSTCGGRGGFGMDVCSDCMTAGYCGDDLTALLECKWVAHSWDGWGEPGTDEVPVYYRAQALWQLDTLGVDEVHVAALGPGGFRAYLVRRDEDDLALMRAAGAEFMRRLEAGEPPELDGHDATIGALKRLHPDLGDGEVTLPFSVALNYRKARTALKEAEAEADRQEALIRSYLESDFNRAVYNGRLIASRSVFEQQRIDIKRLRAEHPEIAAQYVRTTTVDKLNPGRAELDAS